MSVPIILNKSFMIGLDGWHKHMIKSSSHRCLLTRVRRESMSSVRLSCFKLTRSTHRPATERNDEKLNDDKSSFTGLSRLLQ
jgi:hypothetical protein